VIYRFERVIIPIPIWLWDFATRSALVSTWNGNIWIEKSSQMGFKAQWD
jgi:hypothetical protein